MPREQFPFAKPFFAGLGIGSTVSFVVWWFGADASGKSGVAATVLPLMIFVIPLAKLVVSILLIVSPRRRGAGVGLLLSIPVGVLIFFGSCAAHWNGIGK